MKILYGLMALVASTLLPWLPGAQAATTYQAGRPNPASGNTYILLRTMHLGGRRDKYDVVLIRALSTQDESLARSSASSGRQLVQNVIATDRGKAYEKLVGERVYLVPVQPGTYVIAGARAFNTPGAGTCMCMGTVQFEAKEGVVTDLGYILAAREGVPTYIPELVDHVLPKVDYDGIPDLYAMTVRPFREGMYVPASLAGRARVPAQYRAAGSFANPFGMMINRMAPIPGLLSYEGDRVVGLAGR